jgi:hypothetical protein
MEQIQILTDDKFKEIYTDEKLRNAVAFAHGCCNSIGQLEYKEALMYPISYKVTDEQIKEAKLLIEKRTKEVLKNNKTNLLFRGMGMEFEPTIKDGVGNHRIRTSFLNDDGIKCFIELGTSCKGNFLRIDHALFNYLEQETREQQNKYNYKKLESETPVLEYTYKNVLELVNKYFNCSFKKIVLDNYSDLYNKGVLCVSPHFKNE